MKETNKKTLLPYAIEADTAREVTVRCHLKDNYLYLCPFCGRAVGIKQGNIRQHHFFHLKDDYPCSASEESILHERAKKFIHDSLEQKHAFKIIINDISILSSHERFILETLGVSQITINSDQIPAFTYAFHDIEKTINLFEITEEDKEIKFRKPDVTSKNNINGGKYFAWEVFVTHAVDEDKKQYYSQNNIPYIELKPVNPNNNLTCFDFELVSYNSFAFSHLGETSYTTIFKNHSKELSDLLRPELSAIFLEEIKKQAYLESHQKLLNERNLIEKQAIENYRTKIINNINIPSFTQKLRESLCTIIDTNDEFSSYSESKDWVRFKEAKICCKANGSEYIGIYDRNNKFCRISSNSYPEKLLNSFIFAFDDSNPIFALINNSNKIVGIELTIDSEHQLKWAYSNDVANKIIMEPIKLAKIFDNNQRGYKMKIDYNNVIYLKSEIVLKKIIVNLLNQLNINYECLIKLSRDKCQTPYVSKYLFKLLPNKIALANLLSQE